MRASVLPSRFVFRFVHLSSELLVGRENLVLSLYCSRMLRRLSEVILSGNKCYYSHVSLLTKQDLQEQGVGTIHLSPPTSTVLAIDAFVC